MKDDAGSVAVGAVRGFPESTYRVQFHKGFTFADAAGISAYLGRLGVSHAYASPYLKARPGSTHGYDVIDHGVLNPELGTAADYAAWVDSLRSRGMSHILDTVPNHVGVGTNDNAWWNDVLKHGPESKYAHYFDIAWKEASARRSMEDKVLLPVLGTTYGEALEKGALTLGWEGGAYFIGYYDRRFPVDPKTLPATEGQAALATINGSPERLDDLLRRQHYRLCYWKAASEEINYRRFFDINDLAGLRMENEDVFEAAHAFTFERIRAGDVAGLRIDHPDGLLDPAQYFERLQRKYAREVLGDEGAAAGRPLYVVAEKILAVGEELAEDWACHGTSGYDFLNVINGLFVDSSNEEPLTRLYDAWTGARWDFEALAYEKKKLILDTSLASELNTLARQLDRLAQSDRRTQDFTLSGLAHALREVIACFPVYRSYVTQRGVHARDVQWVEAAVERAIEKNPKDEPTAFRYVGDVVLQRSVLGNDERCARFAGKFQQLTAPATAKGIEDTAFYCYHRLISLNEVGGDPAKFGFSPDEVHAYLADRQARWPHAMSALSTHDTKRSEDVRARINVLSEIPAEWREHVLRWREMNAPHREKGSPAPDEEYLIYQTLIGAWPLEPYSAEAFATFVKRVQAYMEKAMREAKLRTAWTAPNEAHENAVKQFVARILDAKSSGAFLNDFLPLQRRVSEAGLVNSLAQTVLRLTAPGVPDTYQGTEVWDYSLVDPDNRRPVDYALRGRLLEAVEQALGSEDRAGAVRAMWEQRTDGRVKMAVTAAALKCRRERPGLFTEGRYVPGQVEGPGNVFAFARAQEGRGAVVVVPRGVTGLGVEVGEAGAIGRAMGETRVRFEGLGDGVMLRDILSGRTVRVERGVRVAELLGDLPVAVLVWG